MSPLAGGDPGRMTLLAGTLAVLIGVICVAGGLLRLGFIADFLAKNVVVGFMHGLAFVIAVGQLPKVLGVKGEGETAVLQLFDVLHNLGSVRPYDVAIGLGCFIVIVACRRWAPVIPGQVVALLAALLAVRLLELDRYGVAVVGTIPSGLPALQLPPFSLADVRALLPVAFVAALLAFSDTMVTASGFASRNHYRIDANRELLAVGVANIGAGLSQSLPISASGSRTAVAEAAGGRSQVVSLVAAIVVAMTLLFLAGPLFYLPQAALGGILIAAAWNLCELAEFRKIWRYRGLTDLFYSSVSDAVTAVLAARAEQ